LETVKRLYEAMILVDSGEAASDWEGINEHIKKIFDRGEAEILSMRKWDDRPLAYEIAGKKRGTYILVYFNSPSGSISAIERDMQLSERIVRAIILRGDHITKEDMEKDTPVMMVDKQVQVQAQAKAQAQARLDAEEDIGQIDIDEIEEEEEEEEEIDTEIQKD
jgi:small subunit ribosomal protein S6